MSYPDFIPYTDDEYQTDAPGTNLHFARWFQNWEAGAGGKIGALIAAAGWHPFNKTRYGGTETGLIYDSAVHGSVSAVTTPDFEDGFEYRLMGQGLTAVNGDLIQANLYRETSAGYAGFMTLRTYANLVSTLGFDLSLAPRITRNHHTLEGTVSAIPNSNGLSTNDVPVVNSVSHGTAQKILRAQLRNGNRNFTTGSILMLRRLLPL